MTALETARRNFERAEHALGQALLRIRNIVPTRDARTSDGRTVQVECDAWTELYYSHSSKNINRFRAELPEASRLIEVQLADVETTRELKKIALAEEKSRKEEKRSQRAADRAEKAADCARPLARVNPVAAANYDVLIGVFAAHREAYAEKFLAAQVWRSGGRVQLDVVPETAREEGRAIFNSYLAKLAKKIGARINSANLQGSIWTDCLLHVYTETGEQVWSTRVIINRSVYNKLFNQWPTRRVS